jgi:hypothetical protein
LFVNCVIIPVVVPVVETAVVVEVTAIEVVEGVGIQDWECCKYKNKWERGMESSREFTHGKARFRK